MVFVAEKVREKIEKDAKWRKENPWHSQEYRDEEPKIYITKELLESKAYRSLSRVAMLVYQDFLSKRDMRAINRKRQARKWVIANNGEIIYPYSEAEENGFSKDQFRKAIDELQEKGLIDIKHQGKGGRKPKKGMGDVSMYWIDDRWKEYGMDAFNPPRKPRIKDKRKGRGWAVYHSKKK